METVGRSGLFDDDKILGNADWVLFQTKPVGVISFKDITIN